MINSNLNVHREIIIIIITVDFRYLKLAYLE